ncbi:MAG: response regulator [Holophagales bacterium]|nr:response regulator [Holophagales bacterium]
MALFGFSKDKPKDGGADPTVMAYLEDAMRIKSPAMLLDPRKNEIPCSIQSINEAEGTMQLVLRANLLAEKGAKITFVVVVDNMRIGGSSKLHEVKPGSAVVDIPASFELMERRKKQRAKINPREGTTCILLSGLFDGIGITGLPENMSENGARVKVEKALEVKSEKPVNVTSRNVQTGQIFPIMKLSKIPKVVATLEGAAKMVYMEVTSGTTYLGISFEEMKSEFMKAIGTFVASRATPLPNSLPPRARRSSVEMDGKSSVGFNPTQGDSKAGSGPQDEKQKHSEPSAAAPPSSPTSQPAAAHETSAQTENAPTNEFGRPVPTPLQKLKRKGKTIILFGTDDQKLVKTLQAEGYGKVCCPENMEGLLEVIQQPGAGLLLMDLEMPLDNCLAIAATILGQLPEPVPVILVSENTQVGVRDALDAQKAGISLVLPRPLKIDNELFNKIEQSMSLGG